MKVVALALLLVLLGACWATQDPGGVRVITIDIEHSAFDPDHLEVEAGETVKFRIVNGDPIDHEFILGDEKVQQIHEEGTEKHHGTRPGEISVPAGATAVTTYTFTEPGDLIYGCHIVGHYDYGMRGAVEVR